jgi:acetate kinase
MTSSVLAVNAGSSSLKFALFSGAGSADLKVMVTGELEERGPDTLFTARDAAGHMLDGNTRPGAPEGLTSGLSDLLGWIDRHLGSHVLGAVGHRIVHGGAAFSQPVLIQGTILGELDALTPLAPLHQPQGLAPVRAIAASRPALPQVACFDTAFHSTMPAVASRLALPRSYEQEGVRRYGFHGLSYEFIARSLGALSPRLAGGRVIVAHLGNGASLCALSAGRSIETTMSFTTLDGLVMGTRCGSIDPGVLLYLMRVHGLGADQIETLLYRQSGLLAVSGLSGDMRLLLASPDPRARDAVDLFVYRIVSAIGALAAALGGLDGFVFTGGIGQHAPEIRAAICAKLGWLGVRYGADTAGGSQACISDPRSAVEVHVVPTDEERMIALHTLSVLETSGLTLGHSR